MGSDSFECQKNLRDSQLLSDEKRNSDSLIIWKITAKEEWNEYKRGKCYINVN